MTKFVLHFIADETAGGAVEYALVLLVALATITMIASNLKVQVSGMITNIGIKLSSGSNNIS